MIIHQIQKKTFLSLLFPAFITEENLKRHIKDCLKINGNQGINIAQKGEYVQFKNLEERR